MLTAGAVVVACFATVSGVVQLIRSYTVQNTRGQDLKTADDSFLSSQEVAFYSDRSIAFGFEIAATLLFMGNGAFWLILGSSDSVCSSVVDNVTSAVAILSTLAFVGSLGRYFVAVTSTLIGASLYVLAQNAAFIHHLCGAVPSAIAVSCLIITIVRALSITHGANTFATTQSVYTQFRLKSLMLI